MKLKRSVGYTRSARAVAPDPAYVGSGQGDLARTGEISSGLAVLPVAPPVAVTGSAFDFQRDLSRYWRYVRTRGQIDLTARGWIYKTAFKSLLEALNQPLNGVDSEQRQPRLLFIRYLLTELGELSERPDSISVQGEGLFFHRPLTERIRRAFEAWRDALVIIEPSLFSEPDKASQSAVHPPSRFMGQLRLALLRAMARIEKSDRLSQSLQSQQDPSGQPRWRSVLNLVESEMRPDRTAGGPTVTHITPDIRAMVLSMLVGPLHWMGLIDLGYEAPEQAGSVAPPVAYRLSQTGLWLLDLAEPPQFVESGGRVIVQPNFTVLAMEPVADSVLIELDQFAELRGGDRAMTYELTRYSVYRGQRAGWNAQRIATFLEQHQGAPLPANVRRSLEEWQALHHRIVFYRSACVAQFADDEAREAACKALSQSGFELTTLGPAHTLIAPANTDRLPSASGQIVSQVVDILTQAGWAPEVGRPAPEHDDTEGCLRLVSASDPSGAPIFEVIFKQPAPSLFALGQLAPLLDHSSFSAGRETVGAANPALHPDLFRLRRPVHITAASIRRALSQHMNVDEILALLAHLHDGPLPDSVEHLIREWARFYGRAHMNPVCLVALDNHDVLHNLLDDPTVGRYLRPIEGSGLPFAVVEPAHAQIVREMLAERGIEVVG